jgi:hypothetical protein
MKNLISYNELSEWNWKDEETLDERQRQVSDYFQCIAECGIVDHDAKRFCRHILTVN